MVNIRKCGKAYQYQFEIAKVNEESKRNFYIKGTINQSNFTYLIKML